MIGNCRKTIYSWDGLAAVIIPNYLYFDYPNGHRVWLWGDDKTINLFELWVLKKIKDRDMTNVRNWLIQNKDQLTMQVFREEYGNY